jgi:glycosyltransferase involved in cell wall biosynthesis
VRVLVVSGIWPPDVGGPASNSPELAAFLAARGHRVEALTTAAAQPAPEPYPVRWVSRRLPRGVRHAAFAARLATLARGADVVHTAGVLGRSALGATLARTPFLVKLPDDPAFERARRLGLHAGDLDEFQRTRGDARLRALRLARDLALRRAAHVVCPSAYLAGLAAGWGVDERRVSVVPNPAPELPPLPEREATRARLGLAGPALVVAGRLNAQKSVGVALEAVAAVEGVSLLVAGEGEERAGLERRAGELGLDGRVRFLGAVSRERVLELLRAADAVLLSSSWENFPHVLVEALAVGTPVIATRVGGVGEIVVEGENGLLAPAGDADALAAVVRRFLRDGELRERLRAGAAPSAARFDPDRLLDRLERILLDAAVARR